MPSVAVSNARIFSFKPTNLYLFILCVYPDSEHVTVDNLLHVFDYSLLHRGVHEDLLTNMNFKHAKS